MRRLAPRGLSALAHFSVIAVVLAGCGPKTARSGPGLFKPNAFPKEEKLDALSARPAPTPQAEAIADVESWTLLAPLPIAYGPAPRVPASPIEAAFGEAVKGKPRLRFTEPMTCVARQLARFHAVNAATPAEDLERFIVARCGSPAVSLQTLVSRTDGVEEAVTDDRLAEAAKGTLARAAADLGAQPEELDVGVGLAREAGKVVILFAAAARPADVDLLSMAAKDGRVAVTGVVRRKAGTLVASVNRGRFEAARCVRDESVPLPKFSFTCEVDAKDAAAWIGIAAIPPERLLSTYVAYLLVAPGGGLLPDTYRRPALPGTASAPAAGIAEGFLDAVNQVRVEAGLPRVRASESQASIADRVAPHFFAASYRLVPESVADTVALGLMAGWKVDDAIVHNSLFTSAWTGQSTDPRRLVASMLDSPGGRTVLLDREADVLAIGTVSHPEMRFLGAVVAAYRVYEHVGADVRAAKVNARITKLRAAKGLGPAKVISGLSKEVEAAVARIETQRYAPKQALQSFLADVTLKAQRSTQGYVFETRDLDDFEIPEDIAESAELPMEIAVAYHRPAGEAWGRWVVLVVTFASERA